MRKAALALLLVPQTALAGPGAEIPIVATIGGLLGVTNNIAAIVYAANDQSFHTPWIVSSCFSTAVLTALSANLFVETADNPNGTVLTPIGALILLGLAAWPAAWSVVSSLSDVEPGDPFGTEYEASPVALDPFAPQRLQPAPGVAGIGFRF